MGITVELRDERGGLVRGLPDPEDGTFNAAGEYDRLIPFEDQSFRLLRYVNPHGDTVFNTLQMQDLLADLDQVDEREAQAIERRGLARLRVIAERCRDEPHLYVWFIGD